MLIWPNWENKTLVREEAKEPLWRSGRAPRRDVDLSKRTTKALMEKTWHMMVCLVIEKTSMWSTESARKNILWCDETIIELFSSDTKHFVWQNPDSSHHPPNTNPTVKSGGSRTQWGNNKIEQKKANSRGQPALEYLRLFTAPRVYIWMGQWHKLTAKNKKRAVTEWEKQD